MEKVNNIFIDPISIYPGGFDNWSNLKQFEFLEDSITKSINSIEKLLKLNDRFIKNICLYRSSKKLS